MLRSDGGDGVELHRAHEELLQVQLADYRGEEDQVGLSSMNIIHYYELLSSSMTLR